MRSEIPIYLAAIGPKNVALAAEIADGWIPVWVSPEKLRGLRRAARRASPASTSPPSPSRWRSPTTSRPRATSSSRTSRCTSAAWARRGRTSTTRSSPATATRREAREIQELYLGGKKMEAIAAVPDALVDEVALVGAARADRRPARGVEGVAGDHAPDPGARRCDAADDGRVGAVKPAELFDLSGKHGDRQRRRQRHRPPDGDRPRRGGRRRRPLRPQARALRGGRRRARARARACATLGARAATSATRPRCRRSSTARSAELGSVDILVNNAGTSWGAAGRGPPARGLAEGDRRQPDRRLPLRPGRRPRDDRAAGAARS